MDKESVKDVQIREFLSDGDSEVFSNYRYQAFDSL